MTQVRSVCIILVALCCPPAALCAQTPPAPTAKLEYIAGMNRRDVPTPTWTNDRLNEYSLEPWRQWEVATGELTANGRVQMKILDADDREYLAQVGLIGFLRSFFIFLSRRKLLRKWMKPLLWPSAWPLVLWRATTWTRRLPRAAN